MSSTPAETTPALAKGDRVLWRRHGAVMPATIVATNTADDGLIMIRVADTGRLWRVAPGELVAVSTG
jgi:hypothetical protein